VPEVDVEGMIGMKKKKYSFSKRKWKEIVFLNSILRIKKVLSKESYRGVEVAMCCSLNCYQHFPWQMMGLFRHEFKNKLFEERTVHTLDIPRRLHRRGDCNRAKFVMLQEKDVSKTTWYKIMGISRSTYMSYKQERK
jgi:hypothetical protein